MASKGKMADAGNWRVDHICEDFGVFQDVLRNMRTIDDRVVHALNTTIPTRSFSGQVDASAQCKVLYDELIAAHRQRATCIKKCIAGASTEVKHLQKQHESDIDNIQLLQTLRKQQSKLRMMQAELNIEEVINDRSTKVFHERCRLHYLPPANS